jgi:predicted nucleic acid-binding protein
VLVVDASAVAELLLDLSGGDEVRRWIARHGYELYAPELIDLEVLSVLRRKVSAGDATEDRAAEAVQDLSDLLIGRFRHGILIDRIWDLRQNFTPYDAAYLALAEALTDAGIPILTADGRYARAIESHTAVDVIHVG